MFRNARQRAIAYAAYKELERMLKEDGEIAPGVLEHVGGESITITLAAGTRVYRDRGVTGDGTIKKRATQNLYGYAVWALFIKRLVKFNQWKAIRAALFDAWREALALPNGSVELQLNELDPELAQHADALRNHPGPDRIEQTPRMVGRGAGNPLPQVRFGPGRNVA